MKIKQWQELNKIGNITIPRNHKYYYWDKINNEINTFVYRNELNVKLLLEKENTNTNDNYEIGKISYYNIPNLITVYYNDENKLKQTITFFNFEQVLSFLKKKELQVLEIVFIYDHD